MKTSSKAASVHDRLLAAARASDSDFNLLLSRYALERFLYRISASRYKDRFLLKGALNRPGIAGDPIMCVPPLRAGLADHHNTTSQTPQGEHFRSGPASAWC